MVKDTRKNDPEINRKSQATFHEKMLDLGYLKRPYYATIEQHEKLKKKLKQLKEGK